MHYQSVYLLQYQLITDYHLFFLEFGAWSVYII